MDYALTCRPNLMRNLPGYSKIDFVLRFRGYWDDRYEKDGELHFFDVLYHLVDDTMEMSEELIDDNDASGKIRHRKFVNRQKLPKVSRTSANNHFCCFTVQPCLAVFLIIHQPSRLHFLYKPNVVRRTF